ncbi:hypothetical protein CBR_g34116 [Chara braunii]|uniref:RNA-directed DNA polymerase n=1 Tax=Chara braunii TaxID=69332 RepID=A0A388LHY1_CHABU|nr:hypothetical protein CBR_g34116 [Chara braunii]|eukprot:GBG81934.1 hypothetical protein CBR_g34116 [Chara braunii]
MWGLAQPAPPLSKRRTGQELALPLQQGAGGECCRHSAREEGKDGEEGVDEASQDVGLAGGARGEEEAAGGGNEEVDAGAGGENGGYISGGVVPKPIQHRIEIEPGSRTPKGAVYRMSPEELEELRRQLDGLLENGWIRPSSPPFGALVLFVPKKEGALRMCIDYRGLNAIKIKNVEPLPRIDDLLDRVQGCRYFSKIDLKSGYHQIEVHPDDQYKTAFRTRYGHYEFIVMLFGLTNAPATFQCCMNNLFRPWLDRFVVVYLDDILGFSKTLEEHEGHLRQILSKLRESNFKINPKKCEWAKTQVLYLGHVLDSDGIRPEDRKIAFTRDWPTPKTLTELRSFLGLANYYRTFVRNFSTIAAPLRRLMKKETIGKWDHDCSSAFKKLNKALIEYRVLKVADPALPFVVTIDASQHGISVVLQQDDDNCYRPVEFMSARLPSEKVAASIYERELYALRQALEHWKHYLLGRHFKVYSDHETLRWLKTQAKMTPKLTRWAAEIDQYDFELKVVKGKYNVVADALSRRFDYFGAIVHYLDIGADLQQKVRDAYAQDPVYSELLKRVREAPDNIRNLLASEARREYHTFESFNKKALDLEATLGGAQTPSTDGRTKKTPQEWKKKGSRLMMVDSDGNQTEIGDVFDLVEGSEFDGEENAEGSNLAAVVKTKAVGRGKGGQQTSQGQAPNPNKIAAWVRVGLDQEVWRDRWSRGACINCGEYGHTRFKCKNSKVSQKIPPKGGFPSSQSGASTSSSSGSWMAKAIDFLVTPQTHPDPTILCTLDVSEALEDLQGEWSRRDPCESWVALSRGPRGEHFVVEVDVGGSKCGTFVDIGSTRNFINHDYVDRLCLKDRVQRLSKPVASTLANKERMMVEDYVKDVVCTFSYPGGEINHKISFLVSNELPFDMLLGMYYLEVAKPQFDWDKKVLKHELPSGRTVRLAKYKASRYSLYEFVVMPFGLCNASGTFQHAMNRIFHDYLDKFVVVYLDDILIFSRSVEEHAQHVDKVLSLLRQHKYKINTKKCEFGRTRILYLGHEVSADGIRPEDAKVASIRDWPRPQSVTEVRSFLGMCGYYRNFIKNYSTITSPLTDLTRLDTPWDWTDECEAAFKRLKHALTHHEVLMVLDPQRPFVVTTDASQYGIGAVLAQQEGKKLRPIEYMSKKMPSKKLAESTYERELYALYKALVHWRHYLLGRFFYLRIDHQTLKWIKTQPVLSYALKRWIEVIDQYDFKLDYLKGEYNKVAYALSRRADYLGALISEFGLSEDVTRSLEEAYKEDPITMDIINKLQAKDKVTTGEFVMVDGLLFLEKARFTRLVVPSRESLHSLFLALWDSGSQCDFIHPRVVKEARLPATGSPSPISVTLGDDKTQRFLEQTVTDLPFFLTLEPTDHSPASRRHRSSAHLDVMETGYDFILGTSRSFRFRSTEADWATNTLVLKTKCGQTYRVPFIGTTATPCPNPPPPEPSVPTPSPSITVTSPRQFAHFIRQDDVTFFMVNVTDLLHYDPPCPDAELIPVEPDPPSISMAPIFTSVPPPSVESTPPSRADADAEELARCTDDLEPAVRDLIREYHDVFPSSFSYAGIPQMRNVKHSIQLVPEYRVHHQAPYRLSIPEATELKRQLEELLRLGFIKPSNSPWGAPVLFARKADGTLRLCIDYRGLNRYTVKNSYPMPRSDELFDRLAGNRFFTKIDLCSCYHQIRVAAANQPKTAF